MKKFNQLLAGLSVTLFLTVGCESMLEVDSSRFITPDEHYIDSPNDTIYSIAGVLSKLEKVALRYVMLGELRGDLMGLTENAGKSLRDIYNFQANAENPFVAEADYYSIINSCNYLINNIDTSKVVNAQKIFYKEFAAAKAIRAWTYMQLALNFKTAKYYEQPILYVKDALKSYPEYTFEQLAPLLIADLEPYKEVEIPGTSPLGSSRVTYFRIRFILGDLYLWTGQYEKAAAEYRELMFETSSLVHYYRNTWTVNNNVFVSRIYSWGLNFSTPSIEQLTVLVGAAENATGSVLDSLATEHIHLTVSEKAIENWAKQKYYHSATVVNEEDGDLRGAHASYYPKDSKYIFSSGSSSDYTIKIWPENAIMKYRNLSGSDYFSVCVYRKTLLYLRYAEAVNRLGKPNLAFAVLKNGMKATTIANSLLVPESEKADPLPQYMNFSDTRFNNNIGIHARGCGNVELAADYVIPARPTLLDSITAVEDLILEELALETAFEGNRYHDLMRVAKRRANGDDLAVVNFLKDKVGDRLTLQNMYLPKR